MKNVVIILAVLAIIYEIATVHIEYGNIKKYGLWWWLDLIYSILTIYLLFTPFVFVACGIWAMTFVKVLMSHTIIDGKLEKVQTPNWFKIFDSSVCIALLIVVIFNY